MSAELYLDNGLPPEAWAYILVGFLPEYRPVLRAVCRAWDAAFAHDQSWKESPVKDPAELFREGNCELVQWAQDRWPGWPDAGFTEEGYRDYAMYCENWPYAAGRSGSISMAFLIRGSTVPDYDLGEELAAGAAREGHLGLARLAKAWTSVPGIRARVMMEAAVGGHEEIVAMAGKWEGESPLVVDLEAALVEAAQNRHEGLVWSVLDWAAAVDNGCGCVRRANLVLCAAAVADDPSLMQTAVDLGAQDFCGAMDSAATHGSVKAAAWLHPKTDPALYSPNEALYRSFSAGRVATARLAKNWGAGPLEAMLEMACDEVNADGDERSDKTCEELAILAKNMGADDYDGMARAAALRGSLDLVVLAKTWGATNGEEVAATAALCGNLDLVVFAKEEWGAKNFDKIARKGAKSYSSKTGLGIVRAAKEWGATNCEEVLVAAASRGSVAVMQFAKDWGAVDFDAAMAAAGRSYRTGAALLAKQWGATNYDGLLLTAAAGGSLDCVKLAREWGASCLEAGAALAARRGHERLVEVFLSWGRVDPARLCWEAAPLGHEPLYERARRNKLVRLVKQWEEATSGPVD